MVVYCLCGSRSVCAGSHGRWVGQPLQTRVSAIPCGFVAIIAIAIIYSYRNQLKGKLYLLYGGGSLFLMGLGIRAMLVG